MRETLRVLNKMEREGFIRRYSIGGAIAALVYMDPFETEDLDVPYEDVFTRVPTPEHLAAIMVDTGRPKDRARFAELREQAALDNDRFKDIIDRHGLTGRFRQWTAA